MKNSLDNRAAEGQIEATEKFSCREQMPPRTHPMDFSGVSRLGDYRVYKLLNAEQFAWRGAQTGRDHAAIRRLLRRMWGTSILQCDMGLSVRCGWDYIPQFQGDSDVRQKWVQLQNALCDPYHEKTAGSRYANLYDGTNHAAVFFGEKNVS